MQIRALRGATEVNTAFSTFLRSMVGLGAFAIDATEITEPGRYLGAFDGDRIVGGADAYSSSLVVPGGARVAHAAVTHVGVLPTHRRRGIVTALVRRQLADIAGRGEIVATLRASEAGIYERFGYGVASSERSQRITTARAQLRAGDGPGTTELVDAAATSALLAGIYRDPSWTGAIDRPPGWWRLHELRRQADSGTEYVVVHRGEDGKADGYVTYRPEDTSTWFSSRERVVTVTDFIAHTDGARTALWRHLLDLDLVDVVVRTTAALDDPLPLAVIDRRAVELGPERDETWLRLVDVERALAARTYSADDPVRVQVVDPLIESNNATFEIGPKSVTRSAAQPDVVVGIAELATVYLGGTRWRHLASVGRVEVVRSGAIDDLDALFVTAELPFAGTSF